MGAEGQKLQRKESPENDLKDTKDTLPVSNGGVTGGRMAGKVAVLTASTSGIGLAIARRLCQDGAKVVISSRKQQNVDSALETLRGEGLAVSGLVCHVGKAEDRERLVQQTLDNHGGIDILISNAAVNPYIGPMLETPESAWDKIFDVNLKAAFMLIKEVVPHMEKRGGGSIILVGSISAFVPSPKIGAYCVSKAAMVGLAKTLAMELAPRHIRLNVMAPGIIKTRFGQAAWESEDCPGYLAVTSMKRLGEPEECAGTAAFLASDDSRFITGETIMVTGGTPGRL